MSEQSRLSEVRIEQARRAESFGRVMLIMVAAGLAVLLGRVVQLKVRPDPRLAPAVGTSISNRVEMNKRGDLLDCKGRVIATSVVGYRAFVDCKAAEDPSTIAVEIARVLRTDPVPIDKRICVRPDSSYVVVDDQLSDWQVEALRKANIKGVGVEPRLIRQYPHMGLAAGLVGKVGTDQNGLTGFESIFDRPMEPVFGKLTYLRDVQRQALWIDPNDYSPGSDGRSVRLSIDLVIQEFAEKRLRQAVEEYNVGAGRMIVLDCRSGEVLAMTDIINHRPGWTQQIMDKWRAIDPSLGRNRCVTDPYEPGSTFKPFIWAVATELGKAHPDEVLPLPEGPWVTPYGRTIHDAHYYGPSSWRKVLVKSMNTGMAMVAERMSFKEMQEAIRRFGFGSRTNCGVPGETKGMVTSPKQWKTYTQSSVAMGQEIAVTPLQMARAFCAFCRDGSMPQLRITAAGSNNDPSADGAPADLPVVRRAIPPGIALTAREAMKGVMEEGTGQLAKSTKYQLFGKSGTAQLPKKGGHGYYQDRYIASFIAGAPYDNPRIVVLCVLEDPDKRKGHFGGAIAGPAVRDIVDDTLTYMGIPCDFQPGTEDEQKTLVSATQTH